MVLSYHPGSGEFRPDTSSLLKDTSGAVLNGVSKQEGGQRSMAVTLNDLTNMTQTELDNLFRRGPMGDIPDGDASGSVIAGAGKPAIILDYSKTSLVAHSVRDEIREVSPGTFLGIVFIGQTKTINFVLQFAGHGHGQNSGAPRA